MLFLAYYYELYSFMTINTFIYQFRYLSIYLLIQINMVS